MTNSSAPAVLELTGLVDALRSLIQQGRQQALRAVDMVQVHTCWEVGRHMRGFFQAFPIRDALRRELSWTHYRLLLRVASVEARRWYMTEAATQNWSSCALERQMGTLYFERLLLSGDRASVSAEAATNLAALPPKPRSFVRDPVIDDLKRGEGDNPTVGILLCEHKDESVVRYSVLNDSAQLFASKYRLVLPSEDELRQEIEQERAAIEVAQQLQSSTDE